MQIPCTLQGGTRRIALVAAGGEEEDLVKILHLVDQHVELDVHEDTAAEGQLANPGRARPGSQEAGHQLFDETLDAGGDVVEAEPRQLALEALDVGVLPEPGLVDDVQAVGREVEVRAEDLVDGLGLRAARIRSQAHHLVFVFDGLHPQIARDRRVHHPDRLQALIGLEATELAPPGDADTAAGAVARVVQRHHQGGVGATPEVEPVGRVGVTGVMLDEPDLGFRHAIGSELACELPGSRRADAPEREIGFDQGRRRHDLRWDESGHRRGQPVPGPDLLTEFLHRRRQTGGRDQVEMVGREAVRLDQPLHRQSGKPALVLVPGKTLLRSHGHDAAAVVETRGRVVPVMDAEDSHA